MKRIRRLCSIAMLLIICCVSYEAQVSITTLGTPGAYNQNFDSLGTTDFNLTDNTSITGAYAFRTSGNATPNVFAASTGSNGTGDFKNYGLTGNADRCFGSLASGSTNTMYLGMRFQNDTPLTLSSVEITYTGEQWRTANGTAQGIDFSFRQSSGDITDLTTGVYTNVAALNFVTPINTTPASGLNGNDPANRVTLTASFPVSVPPGGEFMIRWTDVDDGGTDHGSGIDDLRVVARSGVTAANVSLAGQVRTTDGRGIGKVRVLLSGGNLSEPMYALTNPFGYYQFDNLESGQAYFLTVASKRFRFDEPTRFVSLAENVSDFDFVASP